MHQKAGSTEAIVSLYDMKEANTSCVKDGSLSLKEKDPSEL